MTRRSLKDRAAEYEPVRTFLEQHDDIDDVRINVGMPMEFDPRSGETPKPEGVEFTVEDDSDITVLQRISEACDRYTMKVQLTPYKQPNFTWTDHRGEDRILNENVDYDAFVRLVPVREGGYE